MAAIILRLRDVTFVVQTRPWGVGDEMIHAWGLGTCEGRHLEVHVDREFAYEHLPIAVQTVLHVANLPGLALVDMDPSDPTPWQRGRPGRSRRDVASRPGSNLVSFGVDCDARSADAAGMRRSIVRLARILASTAAVVCLGASPSLGLTCGDVLVGPATYALDADLECSTGPALTLRDRAILRMRRHTVHIAAVTSVGVVIEGTEVRLLDGKITADGVSGVLLRVDGTEHVIRNVHTRGHVAGVATGIETLPTSRHVKIVTSSAEFSWDGLAPSGTAFRIAGEEHSVMRSRGSRGFEGFRLVGLRHRFARNEAIGVVMGVYLDGVGHLVAGTLVTLSGDGIFVAGDGHRILRNRVKDNVIGILTLSTNTLFRHNISLGNFPDMRDDTIDCGSNTWIGNRFDTVESFGDCIR